jgi:ABC-2 type transport system permease protein
MTTESTAAAMEATRPMYWSVRRELWERRSLYIAPVVAAAVGLLIFVLTLLYRAKVMDPLSAVGPDQPLVDLAMPYSHTEMLILATVVIIGFVYCLDTLHAERRDRSILFWKSLPVSDLTAVLAKASVPLLWLPLIAFVCAVVTQWIMLVIHTAAVLIANGSVNLLWGRLPLLQLQVSFFYSLFVLALWYAPLYMWCLLVSAWAKRTPFLWAVLPPVALCLIEALAFHTLHLGSILISRLRGFAGVAYRLSTTDGGVMDPHLILLSHLSPGRFLIAPGLWIGLVVAAAFLAAAVRLRRDREPI